MKIRIALFLTIFLFNVNSFASEYSDYIVKIHVGKIYNSEEERLYSQGELVYLEGTGLILNNNKVLTSANLLRDSNWITINKENLHKWYRAKIVEVSYITNLAILEIENYEISETLKPISFAKKVEKESIVSVVGFEAGNNELTISKNLISRIKKSNKNNYNINFPVIQIDRDLNHIISGAVVLNLKNELVGIGMQPSEYFSSKAYIVPIDLIRIFLNDLNYKKRKRRDYFFKREQFINLFAKGKNI